MEESNKKHPGTFSEEEIQKERAEIKKLEIKAKQEEAQLKELEDQSNEPKGLPHYIGADFVYVINNSEETPYEIQVHFEDEMTPSELSNDSTHEFNTNVVPSYDSQSKSLEGQIKSENGILDQLNKEAVKASQKADQDKSARDKAKNELAEKQGIFTQADGALTQVTQKLQKAEERKGNLEHKLDKDKETKQIAQDTFDKFKQTHEQLFNVYQEAVDNQTATQKQLDKLQAVVDNAKTDIERHNAQRVLNNWKNGAYKIASDSVAANQKNVDAWNAQVNEIKDMPEYIALTNSNAAMQQVIDNYDQAKINSANAEKVAAEIAPLQDAYDKAVSLLKAYQTSLADAQAKLAAMKGETTPSEKPGDNEGNKPGNDDQQQPGDNQGNDSSVNGGSASTNNGAASTTVNGNHAATNKVVAASTTVNGNHAATNKVVAASLASVKASTKGASAAATAKDSNVLPQTGNENSAAVVALGAVSAMFGLGLAAKKREF